MPTVLISSPHAIPWYRHFPDGKTTWNSWHFVFEDKPGQNYDYLVAFDDLEKPIEPRCPRSHTIHVAAEPPSIKRYNKHYLNQFGIVLTVDPKVIHPHTIHTQLGINWFIGWNPSKGSAPDALSFREIENLFDHPKTKLISVIASNKTGSLGHRKRLEFAQALKEHFGDRIDFYGRGFGPMEDKLDALKDYRFHITLENSQQPHYFTEKLSDCIMAGCYPIYWGCTNLNEYLPENSYTIIDISNLDESIAIIEKTITKKADIAHRDALREARKKIMHEHNLFPMLCQILESHASGAFGDTNPPISYGKTLAPLTSKLFKRRRGLIYRCLARIKNAF
tara:strand:- start:1738 stop:2745 length:1008 start_codon:yes stop_codon:yes gene_type:complete